MPPCGALAIGYSLIGRGKHHHERIEFLSRYGNTTDENCVLSSNFFGKVCVRLRAPRLGPHGLISHDDDLDRLVRPTLCRHRREEMRHVVERCTVYHETPSGTPSLAATKRVPVVLARGPRLLTVTS
jgi:hypothetical protein